MAKLTDRLDFVIGKRSADPLEEHFGIVTVNDLLRHYPRKYSDEMTTAQEGEELEEGEHVTFVDRITKVELRLTNRSPQREYMVVTIGDRRPKVTATFFNVKIIKRTLKEGQRVMLSGEVGYFKGTLQLTHPGFLVIHDDGRVAGTRSLTAIARAEGTADENLSLIHI